MKLNFFIAVVLSLALISFVRAEDVVKPLAASGFCKASGLKANDGTQIKEPNCVSLEIGELPSVDKMVSAIIIEPRFGQTLKRNQTFTVRTKIINIETAFFSDPAVDYYQIAQKLNGGGIIQGHSHITIQRLNGNNVPDPKIFAFFKGLNEKAVNGVLSVEVTNGLPLKGLHRICTMNASNSHQPVVMPVAQRGAQDDCIRVNVI